MDKSSERLRDHEWQSYIRARRRRYNAHPRRGNGHLHDTGDHAPDDLTGIALSGGGIRSATFALGVLQALAYHDLLRRFDYLSTVSGGGYIGTSLTWLTSKVAANRARADEEAKDEADNQIEAPSLPASGFAWAPPTRKRPSANSRQGTPHLFPTAATTRKPGVSPTRPRPRARCSDTCASTATI